MSSDPLTTELLLSLRSGDGKASDQLVSRLYEDLRGIARQRLRQLRPGQTMDTTSLVHEAYIRLVDGSRVDPRDRGHFLALASRAMRFVLVDHARSRGAEKRGGGGRPTPWSGSRGWVRTRWRGSGSGRRRWRPWAG